MIITAVFGGIVSCIGAWNARQARNASTEVRDNQNIVAKKSDIAAEKADVAAKKAEETATRAEENSKKLNEVHTLTDGNLTRTQAQLEQERRKNQFLEDLVMELTSKCGPDEIEIARKRVAEKQAKIGKRRKTDVVRQEDVR